MKRYPWTPARYAIPEPSFTLTPEMQRELRTVRSIVADSSPISRQMKEALAADFIARALGGRGVSAWED